MRFLHTLESKFGRFAIPGLVQTIALLQLLVFIIQLFMGEQGGVVYTRALSLDMSKVLQGEVWRLVTHVFISPRTNIVFAVLGTMMVMWIGRTLDEAWGAFRVNLYVFGWMLVVTLAVMVSPLAAALVDLGLPTSLFLYQTLLFAMATLFPNEEISMYFVLPVKMKWVAWLTLASTIFMVMKAPVLLMPVLAAHLNYLVAFGPGLFKASARHAQVVARRNRFESAKLPEDMFFHQCSVCKKTELDNPQLEFRVLDSGEEICSECRAQRAAAKT